MNPFEPAEEHKSTHMKRAETLNEELMIAEQD